MAAIAISVLIGYLLGCLSPSAFFSMLKKKDVSKEGTGNRGATNTMLVLGKKYGVLVMIVDVAKAYLAVKLAKLLFPKLAVAGVVAGCSAVIGHIFPFYLNFKGGKGLSALGGMILGLDPILFPILVVIGLTFMFIANIGYAMPISAASMFPVLYGFRCRSLPEILMTVAVSALIIYQNVRAMQKKKNEVGKTDVRKFIKNGFHK